MVRESTFGQLVNDDNDIAELFRNDDVIIARDDDFLVHFDSETVCAGFDFLFPGFERQFRLGFRERPAFGPFVE